LASDVVGETTVCVAARSQAPFASAMCHRITTNQTSFFPTLSGVGIQAAGGVTARMTDSIYLYGEYDYANNDRVRIPWAVDAGLRWVW
jgi:outer membrane autotransporter protein